MATACCTTGLNWRRDAHVFPQRRGTNSSDGSRSIRTPPARPSPFSSMAQGPPSASRKQNPRVGSKCFILAPGRPRTNSSSGRHTDLPLTARCWRLRMIWQSARPLSVWGALRRVAGILSKRSKIPWRNRPMRLNIITGASDTGFRKASSLQSPTSESKR